MKKVLLLIGLIILLFSRCSNYNNGELMGVQDRPIWFEPDPTGMVLIPMGSYQMGPNDQDVPWSMNAQSKTVSIQAFWMDETEITNNEYRQFVYWVRDSIAYKLLGEQLAEQFLITENDYAEEYDPPFINWNERIRWDDEEQREILKEMYLPEHERFYRVQEFDTRKYNFEYYWIDLKQASQKFNFSKQIRSRFDFDEQQYNGEITSFSVERQGNKIKRDNVGKVVPVKDRSSFIMKDVINVYPDTLCWIRDFTYSYNEPMAKNYFWHPAYDHYPVVGINWRQARAFSIWRTQLYNSFQIGIEEPFVNDFRLPTESEWEYAARGGLNESMYPWGGYYTRNYNGCYIVNFKPLRGNYPADGGFHTVIVAHYGPNPWGLYDMAGNVAEWTDNSFDESAYSFEHDLNSHYYYEALPDDPPVMKRKIIRGGSWKDIAWYCQCATRTYEYMDTAKSYIGFRNVRTFLGRRHDKEITPDESAIY